MEFTPAKFNELASKIIANLEMLGSQEVLIGIPGGDKHEGDPVDNAALGYWHEFGVPEHHLPARPFLIPGVQEAAPKVADILEKAAIQSADITKKRPDVKKVLDMCGTIAATSVRKQWDKNSWAPLASSTILKRIKQTGKGGNKKWKAAKAAYDATGDITKVVGLIQPLLDTGALRQSITYVIEKRGDSDVVA